jgi:hypothetical protein
MGGTGNFKKKFSLFHIQKLQYKISRKEKIFMCLLDLMEMACKMGKSLHKLTGGARSFARDKRIASHFIGSIICLICLFLIKTFNEKWSHKWGWHWA